MMNKNITIEKLKSIVEESPYGFGCSDVLVENANDAYDGSPATLMMDIENSEVAALISLLKFLGLRQGKEISLGGNPEEMRLTISLI